MVKRYAAAAGQDPAKYAGHSLRAGLVTQAAMNGVQEPAIMRQTRHKSSDVLRQYIWYASLFREKCQRAGAAVIQKKSAAGFVTTSLQPADNDSRLT